MWPMIKKLAALVALLWLAAAAMACGGPAAQAGEGQGPMAKKSIEDVLKEYTAQLMSVSGVVGVAQGLCSKEPCIRVFVVEKTDELLKQIPTEIEGYEVDIQKTGEFRKQE